MEIDVNKCGACDSGRSLLVTQFYFGRVGSFIATQLKFSSISMLPDPRYRAYSGYGHSGRVRPGQGVSLGAIADTRFGGASFSTQSTSAVNRSNWLVAGPPPQWPIPGTKNIRTNSAARPRYSTFRACHHFA